MCPKKNLKNVTSKELLFMANGTTRYYPQPEGVQLIFGQSLSRYNERGLSGKPFFICAFIKVFAFRWKK
jgi:hypothetical protein